jgi:hypothetical protein
MPDDFDTKDLTNSLESPQTAVEAARSGLIGFE